MHKLAIIAYNGLCHFEFASVLQVFRTRDHLGHSTSDCQNNLITPKYEIMVIGIDPSPMTTRDGISLTATHTLASLKQVDTIIIPGWRLDGAPIPPSLIRALQQAHREQVRLVSICTGAFVLAEAGLLNGKRATTHWQHTTALQQQYPSINVDPDVLFISEDKVLTSAGSAAGIDLCLHIVASDFGAQAANRIARDMVVPPVRQGGQAQFVDSPHPKPKLSDIAPLLDTLSKHPEKPYTIDGLAKELSLSRRTFLRRFHDATGTTPGEWLLWKRLDKARHLLESTRDTSEVIALQSGFGSAETLRHHFRKRLRISPSNYRRQHSLIKPEVTQK